MKSRIVKELDEIEKRYDVKVIYACESGSRAWGFESEDSDYDVRFIYVHPKDWYLTIADKRDVIEIPFDGVLDINGWDIRKSLKLLRKSNSPLHEWLSSPIRYRSVQSVMNSFVELSAEAFLPESSCHHYMSMAKNIISNFIDGEKVKIKSYLYSLRTVLCCNWISRRKIKPPMKIQDLLKEFLPSGELRELVDDLIYAKSRGTESVIVKRSLKFEEYLRKQLNIIESNIPKNPKKIPIEKFDSVFQEMLSRSNYL
jgi:predicted nucleotidyltransferase